MRNVLDKRGIESKNTYFMVKFFSWKLCRLWDNVERYGGARKAKNDVTIWRIRVACWISKAEIARVHMSKDPVSHTHARAREHTDKHVILYLLRFHGNNNSRTHLNITLYVHCLSCHDLKQPVRLDSGTIFCGIFFKTRKTDTVPGKVGHVRS